VHFDRMPGMLQCLVEMREVDTASAAARFCELAAHNWAHVGGVREGDVFVQRLRCKWCSAERQLRFNLINGELVGEEPSDRSVV
jgi:hypothetical protein